MASTRPLPAPISTGLLTLILIVLAVATARPGAAEAATVCLSWNTPITNADGSQLADLASYRIYLGTTVPACPGGSFHAVSSSTTRPGAGQIVSARVTALRAGTTYFVRVTAVDTSGNESACSPSVSGVARPDLAITPAGGSSFGAITVGGTSDRTFTVENTGSQNLSGSASVGAPFSIVSGASFSLAPGASRTVTVRFRPTSAGSFVGNVTFTANGESVSRAVSGSATSSASATLSVSKTGPGVGTVTSAPAGIACGSDCAETLPAGTPVTLTATATSGSTFAGWSGACSGTGTCRVTVSAATAVTAAFNTGQLLPAPVVSSLSPARATAGSGALTLSVNGRGFVRSSSVRWNGAARTTTFVSATQLRAAISAADLATARSVPVTVVTPAPGGGTSAGVMFAVTTSPPPPAPAAPSVTRVSSTSTTVTFTIAWNAVSGGTSYRYAAAFTDGSGSRQGSLTNRSFQLVMPYHASGAGFTATVCIRSVNASGQQSAGQACSPVPVPARPVVAPSPPAPPPPPPPPPPPDWGWGVG